MVWALKFLHDKPLWLVVPIAWLVLGEKLRWNYAVSMPFILLAVIFAFAFDKPAVPAA